MTAEILQERYQTSSENFNLNSDQIVNCGILGGQMTLANIQFQACFLFELVLHNLPCGMLCSTYVLLNHSSFLAQSLS